MSITVPFDLEYEFEVKAPIAEVFGVLADVPLSASHFPGVEKLVDLGGDTYRWELHKVGSAQIHIQTVYTAKYVADAHKHTVIWTPVAGGGNALVGGSWTLAARKGSTHLRLKLDGEITVPLPALMKPLVVPVVMHENEKLVDIYIDNLIQRFGGEV